MKREILFFAALSIIILLFLSDCHKNPVEPPFNIRNLTWTIDTLAHPDNWQTLIRDIWGISANDVYAVGFANTTRGILWHYNGKKWTDVKISITQGGPISGVINFDDVFGFGKNDVWICGDRGVDNPNPPPDFYHKKLLIHWDGRKWEDVATPDGYALFSIWGNSPDNVWFCGAFGTLFHYDGTIVKSDTVPLKIPLYNVSDMWIFLSITGNETESDMLLWGNKVNASYYYLFNYHDNKWVIADSTFFHSSRKLWMSPSGTLYSIGETTYKRQGNTWTKILDWHTLEAFEITGTDDDNLFAVGIGKPPGDLGAVMHYNGSNWFSYKETEIPGAIFYDVWTDGKEVFVVGNIGYTSIVLHGK